jgi:DNA sulfur modification protein DndD
MQINLIGWASSGLRCPDVELNLIGATGGPAKVALIQMPNGTGKTTTLELLKATLTGEAVGWAEEKVRSYRRHGDAVEKGRFRVELLIDNRPLTFELTLHFDSGQVSYKTTSPGSGGVTAGFKPPASMMKFLQPAFLDLFIFDGEFADELLEKNAGRADEAIDALCQLYLLEQIEAVAEAQWKSRTSKGGATSPAALQRLHQQRTVFLKRRDDLRRARSRAEERIDKDSADIAELAKRISDRISSVEYTQTQQREAELALQAANSSVSRACAEVMTAIRMPIALHPIFPNSLVKLKENLDHLKLPETTSAQFFDDLCQEPDCICGRTMNDVARDEIKKRAKGYLDAEESGTINALKHDIGTFVGGAGESSICERLRSYVATLTEARRDQRQAEQTQRALQKRLIDAGDEELKGWKISLEEKEADLADSKAILLDIDAANEDEEADPIMSLKLLDRKLSETQQKIATITKTVTLRAQTDLLDTILENTIIKARERIRADLVQVSNERLEVILANDPLRISRIDKSLHLANQGGASMGQKLSVGYTFLMSALSRGNNDFPLIVDSPANPLDAGVRRNIGRLIPTLCSQFVAFTINTERLGFVSALEETSDDCLFITMFRKTEGTQRLTSGLPLSGVTKSDNAILVRDRDYFMSFDITTEGEA